MDTSVVKRDIPNLKPKFEKDFNRGGKRLMAGISCDEEHSAALRTCPLVT